MLANHHSCGAPLFRCKGEIICPACSLEEGDVKAGAEEAISNVPSAQEEKEKAVRVAQAEREESAPFISHKGEAEVSGRDESDRALGLLRRVLLHRLEDLTKGVESEGDLDKLQRQLSCIEGIVNILATLER